MPDRYESETMKGLRREHPDLFKDDPAPAAPGGQSAPEEPQFNTRLGRGLAHGYVNALSNRWMRKQRDRIVDETDQSGDTQSYLDRMRRLQDRFPEVQRLNRERMNYKP